MTWYLIFCAWGYKSGGCQAPTPFPSRAACEFVLCHQRDVAARGYNDSLQLGSAAIGARCVGVRR